MHGFMTIPNAEFDGDDYRPELDKSRLRGQILRVADLMSDGKWRTLRQIAAKTGDGEASISAQLRNLRKEKHGGHTVDSRRVKGGLYEYQLTMRCLSPNDRILLALKNKMEQRR